MSSFSLGERHDASQQEYQRADNFFTTQGSPTVRFAVRLRAHEIIGDDKPEKIETAVIKMKTMRPLVHIYYQRRRPDERAENTGQEWSTLF
jgi:hypothetical protein